MSALDISIFIISVAGILLEMQQKAIFWLTYIVGSILLGYEFWIDHLYGSSFLQIMYICLSLYGWYKWTSIDNTTHHKLEICHTKLKQWIQYLIFTLIIGIIIFYILRYFKDDSYLYDAILTAICLTVTYMSALKQIESWFVFTIVGVISTILYYRYHLYFTAITYIIFSILDFIGGIKWLIDYNKQKQCSKITAYS